MIGRQEEVTGRARRGARDARLVVVEAGRRHAGLFRPDVIDHQAFRRFAIGRADERLAHIDQHPQMHRPHVVRVDLIAPQEQLMRTLQRVCEPVRRVVAHQVVDPDHGVEMAVVRTAAGAEDDAEIGERRGRRGEARKEVLVETDRLHALAEHLAGGEESERLQRARDSADLDREIVGVVVARLQHARRRLGNLDRDQRDMQMGAHAQGVDRIGGEEDVPAAGSDTPLPQLERDVGRITQRDPDGDERRLDSAKDRTCQQER